MRAFILLGLLFYFFSAKAQLGFCTGSKGDPIFQEDFGSGNGTGSPLSPSVTSYSFVTGDPNDGQYTVSSQIGGQNGTWHSYFPSTTISGGNALIVNADDNSAGQFYRFEVSGLCQSTTYEFSAFLINVYNRSAQVCDNGGIPINVKFQIWDETETILLAEGDTGDIGSTTSPQWQQFALTFQSQSGQDAVILKMFNNGIGGCGNDLAIDDIIFRSCGDLITITSPEGTNNTREVCEEDSPVQVSLNASPDNEVYSSHFYQWQVSNNSTDWTNIVGANDENYTDPVVATTKYYRVKVAENPVNLSGSLCNVVSDPFLLEIIYRPEPPESLGDKLVCENETIPPLQVNPISDDPINWYDASVGGNLLAENTNSYTPTGEGTFYAAAIKPDFQCETGQRTPVRLTISEVPNLNDQNFEICPDSQILLDAGITNLQYSWSTGENTQSIYVDFPGTYTVEVKNNAGCSAIKTIVVEAVPQVGIEDIISDNEMVTIIPAYEGDFLYSLDGSNFQTSNIFSSVAGGIYTAYIKDLQSCNLETRVFPHIVIPRYISPNNDGYHDRFEVKGLEYFEASEIIIFDRYGKFIAGGRGADFSWDGKYEEKVLPAGDYWYKIKISGYPDETGHFSIIR